MATRSIYPAYGRVRFCRPDKRQRHPAFYNTFLFLDFFVNRFSTVRLPLSVKMRDGGIVFSAFKKINIDNL